MCDVTHSYVRDTTHSYVWHESYICDMTIYIKQCHAPVAKLWHRCTHSYVWHDSFICVWHDSFICVTWVIYLWHDHLHQTMSRAGSQVAAQVHAFICVTWLIHMCVTWSIHMCDMTHSYVTWLVHICGLIHLWHDHLHKTIPCAGIGWLRLVGSLKL